MQSLSDHASFLSTKISFLLDAVLGLINLEQNNIIKIFSVAAVMFLPPTLVASVYGMNFHFMPRAQQALGLPARAAGDARLRGRALLSISAARAGCNNGQARDHQHGACSATSKTSRSASATRSYAQFDIDKVLERLLLKGSIVVKKAYCDWDRYKEFKASMHEASFELIEIRTCACPARTPPTSAWSSTRSISATPSRTSTPS